MGIQITYFCCITLYCRYTSAEMNLVQAIAYKLDPENFCPIVE